MKDEEEKLLALFEKLDSGQRQTLIDFAGFLATRATQDGDSEPAQVLPIARPDTETVVMAIKRLIQTYPMLDRRKLFGDTSKFVAQHALEGRPAVEVIDELEIVFARHFERMQEGKEGMRVAGETPGERREA
jgi:hypothetical protein